MNGFLAFLISVLMAIGLIVLGFAVWIAVTVVTAYVRLWSWRRTQRKDQRAA